MHITFRPVIFLSLLLAGCASMGGGPQKRIVGEWRSFLGGYPVLVTYTSSTVRVDNSSPVGYRLNGNHLSFPKGGSQVRLVTFPSRTEMIQTDPLTGTTQHYTRVAPGT